MTSEEEAKKAILKLFQCFASTGSDSERKFKFTAYWEVLGGLSPDAVVAVCRRASRGEICKHGFLPTAAELYQAVQSSTPYTPRYRALAEPRRYIPPAERAFVLRGLKDLVVELRAGQKQLGVIGWQSVGDIAISPLREWTEAPKVSDELAKHLGHG